MAKITIEVPEATLARVMQLYTLSQLKPWNKDGDTQLVPFLSLDSTITELLDDVVDTWLDEYQHTVNTSVHCTCKGAEVCQWCKDNVLDGCDIDISDWSLIRKLGKAHFEQIAKDWDQLADFGEKRPTGHECSQCDTADDWCAHNRPTNEVVEQYLQHAAKARYISRMLDEDNAPEAVATLQGMDAGFIETARGEKCL